MCCLRSQSTSVDASAGGQRTNGAGAFGGFEDLYLYVTGGCFRVMICIIKQGCTVVRIGCYRGDKNCKAARLPHGGLICRTITAKTL